jgi:hypothetical protein
MNMAQTFADIAIGVSATFGGPYHPAVARWPGVAVYDDGGSIVAPGVPIEKPCHAHVDSATDRMRLVSGFTEKDMGLFVLAATLDGEIDTSASVEILGGPHAGLWSVESVNQDGAGIYWECRGRRA